MTGHGAKYNLKKEQAITALLFHRNVDAAASAVGIGTTTLLRWMRNPAFEAACKQARQTAFSQAIDRLRDASGAAVTTVLKVMLDPKVPAGIRLRAAEVVLERAATAGEIENLEQRVAELERTGRTARKSIASPEDLTWLGAKSLSGVDNAPPQIAAPAAANTELPEEVID